MHRFILHRGATMLIAGLALAKVPAPVCAAVVTAYDLSQSGGSTAAAAPTEVATGVTADPLARSAALVLFNPFGYFGAYNWPTTTPIDQNKYFTFTIRPIDGATMSLTRVSFAEKRKAQGPRNFELRSSLDNFASALVADTTTAYPDASFELVRHQTYTLGDAFANRTGAVEFRLYASWAVNAGAAGTWQIGNYDGPVGVTGGVIVEGNVTLSAVPEAGAWQFAVAGAGIAVGWRRLSKGIAKVAV